MMIKTILSKVFSTDTIPVIGGSAGAVVGHLEILVTTIILAIIGAVVGYVVKLVLDKIVKHHKDKKNKPPKVEFRSL